MFSYCSLLCRVNGIAELVFVHLEEHCLNAELKGGTFKACRFARDGRLGLFTVVNHQGRGHILYWSQSDLGELMLANQTRANCFSAPITAFDISAKGKFLGTGTSEGKHKQRPLL